MNKLWSFKLYSFLFSPFPPQGFTHIQWGEYHAWGIGLSLIDEAIEFFNHRIDLGFKAEDSVPVILMILPLGIEFRNLTSLLLNPGEILEIMNPFTVIIPKLLHVF